MADGRYAGPEFQLSESGGSNFLASDPYQFTLDVAPPIMEADEYAEEPESITAELVRPATVYQRPSPAAAQIDLEDEDEELQEEDEIHDEEIGRRMQHQEWDFSELGKDGFDLQACEWAVWMLLRTLLIDRCTQDAQRGG